MGLEHKGLINYHSRERSKAPGSMHKMALPTPFVSEMGLHKSFLTIMILKAINNGRLYGIDFLKKRKDSEYGYL